MDRDIVKEMPASLGDPDPAETLHVDAAVGKLLPALEQFLAFSEPDRVIADRDRWMAALDRPLPSNGAGLETVLDELSEWVVPYGLRTPHPAFSGYIIGRATTAGIAAGIAAQVAGHFRHFLTSLNFLEQLSLDWVADLCGIRPGSAGVYSSGGSSANLLAIGAARQAAFESIGVDPAGDGLPAGPRPRIYGGAEVHHTIHRAAGVLGLGRHAFTPVESDAAGRLVPTALDRRIRADRARRILPVAIVAVAGSTSTGAIEPIDEIADIAAEHGVWFHVDGAYGLPANVCRSSPAPSRAWSGLTRRSSTRTNGWGLPLVAVHVRSRCEPPLSCLHSGSGPLPRERSHQTRPSRSSMTTGHIGTTIARAQFAGAGCLGLGNASRDRRPRSPPKDQTAYRLCAAPRAIGRGARAIGAHLPPSYRSAASDIDRRHTGAGDR